MKIKIYSFVVMLLTLAACESHKQTHPESSNNITLNEDISTEIFRTKWTKTKVTKGNLLDLQETPNGNLLAATPNGLLISKDDGISWTEIYDKAVVSQQINCISSDGKKIYISVEVKGVFASLDNGITWKSASVGMPSSQFAIRDIQCINGKLYAGTSNGIYFSEDSSQSWQELNNGIPMAPFVEGVVPHHINVHSIIAGKSKIFAISDKGILIRDIDSTSWKLNNADNTTTDITSVMISGTDEMYAGKYLKDGIYKSSNNGETWESTGLKGFNLQKVHISIHGVLYAGTHENGIYRSLNKGKTWHELNKGLPKKANINAITSTQKGSIVIGVENSGIYRLAN